MKQTSQRSLLFRQNVNRTEAEWVHFLDGYRKALIEFDMKKFGDDWRGRGGRLRKRTQVDAPRGGREPRDGGSATYDVVYGDH